MHISGALLRGASVTVGKMTSQGGRLCPRGLHSRVSPDLRVPVAVTTRHGTVEEGIGTISC